jgi:hypothetical protein
LSMLFFFSFILEREVTTHVEFFWVDGWILASSRSLVCGSGVYMILIMEVQRVFHKGHNN